MFGRDICEKYQSRDEKLPKPNGEGKLISRLVFFANTPPKHDSLSTGIFSQIPLPNMIYLFNYTEYYLEHWLNK